MPPAIPLIIAAIPTITAAATAAGGAAAAAGAGAGIAASTVAGLTALGSAVTAGVASGTTAAVIGGVTLAGSLAGTVAAGVQTFSKPKSESVEGFDAAAASARQRAIDRQRRAFGSTSSRMVSQRAAPPVLSLGPTILGPVAAN